LLLYCLLFGAAALGAVLPDFPLLLKSTVIVLLGVSAAGILRRHILLLHPESVVALRRFSEQWSIHTRDGNSRPVRLTAAAFWVFGIITLVFTAADGKRFTVLLAPTPAESLRELRAWMRHRLPAA
jgi:hypothetical protein